MVDYQPSSRIVAQANRALQVQYVRQKATELATPPSGDKVFIYMYQEQQAYVAAAQTYDVSCFVRTAGFARHPDSHYRMRRRP